MDKTINTIDNNSETILNTDFLNKLLNNESYKPDIKIVKFDFECNDESIAKSVAQAILDDETREFYCWVLECVLKATNYIESDVFMTDANPAMISVISNIFPNITLLY
ncbi:14204_t:CDS:2, partial [Cetraspora pellucida]